MVEKVVTTEDINADGRRLIEGLHGLYKEASALMDEMVGVESALPDGYGRTASDAIHDLFLICKDVDRAVTDLRGYFATEDEIESDTGPGIERKWWWHDQSE